MRGFLWSGLLSGFCLCTLCSYFISPFDFGGLSEIGRGVTNPVISSLLENAVSWKIKRGGVPSTHLIHGHAPCLSGRRFSSAVHHFGG